MKFKVGDKVRVIKGKRVHIRADEDFYEFLKENNNVLTIAFADNWYEVKEDRGWYLEEDELELFSDKKPTKEDLLNMPVGTKIYTDAENKKYQVWVKVIQSDFTNGNGDYISNSQIKDDLTFDEVYHAYGTKIIKIEEPTYETIYDYSTEVQEMTVAEIEKALGHAVKIIKEDK